MTDYQNISGNHYDKYHTQNPVARALMRRFLRDFDDFCNQSDSKTVYEFGCGEGELALGLAKKKWLVKGSDIECESVKKAQKLFLDEEQKGEFEVLDVMDFDARKINANLVVCCEVLEHLPDPEKALRNVAEIDASHFIFSVPREPLWRILNMMRAKYVMQWGNTPGHIQHWSTERFTTLIGEHLEIVAVRKPLPWTMILCRKTAAKKL